MELWQWHCQNRRKKNLFMLVCGNAIAENGRKKKIVVAEIICEELKKKKSATSIIFLQQITGD